MKRLIFALFLIPALSNASEMEVLPYNQNSSWSNYTPIVSDWVTVTDYYDCSKWSPDASTIKAGQEFVQVAKGCKLNQRRFVQARQIESNTDVVRNVGKLSIEENILVDQEIKRNAVGTNTKECYFSNSIGGTMGTYFRYKNENTNKFRLEVIWKGGQIASSIGVYDDSITSRVFENDGYKYYLGKIVSTHEYPFGYYEVCRDIIK